MGIFYIRKLEIDRVFFEKGCGFNEFRLRIRNVLRL